MVTGSEIYLHAIVDVMSLTEVGENEAVLAMIDAQGNQVTLRLRDTALRSLQRVFETGAITAP
jgi:hypothetical protein